MKQFFKKNLQLIAVSTGHFTNDLYMALIPPVLFIFSSSLGLTLAQQSTIAFLIITGGSVLQPVLGYFLDKIGKSSYLIVSIAWISFMMCITGIITNYYLLLTIAGLASVASSIYHPLGSSIVLNLSKGSSGKSLSIFLTIGGFAFTLAPMISIPVASTFGLRYLVFLMIPGFMVAYFLKFAGIDKIKFRVASEKEKVKKGISRNKAKWLSLLVFMSAITVSLEKIMIVFGVQIMIMKGIAVIPAGIILSAHLFLRSLGTLSGGYLLDNFGERRIMIIFSILAFGFFTIALFSQGLLFVIGILFFGYMQNGTATPNITITHHILPDYINLGTGAIIGLSQTIAGILILVFGKFSDIYGLMEVAQATALLFIIPVLISLSISKKYQLLKVKLETVK